MRRILSITLTLCATAAATFAQARGEDTVGRATIHRPQDVAPPQQVIVPRSPAGYRTPGGLLRQATHIPRKVDPVLLAQRKRRLALGERFDRPIEGDGKTPSPTYQQAMLMVETTEHRGSVGAIAYWCLVMSCGVAGAWLTMKALLSRTPRKSHKN